jgi:CelD/BcsL family acetyltransferase involved in cellulose biosynthesis
MSSGLTATFIRDEASLVRLAPEWWRLWERSPAATPFQSPAWLIAWWRAFKPGELLSLAVHLGDRLAGLAPFYLECDGERTRLLPVGTSISDYLDVLVDRGVQEPVLAAIAASYARCSEPWNEWEMTELPPHASALRVPVPDGFEEETGATTTCPVLDLAEGIVPAGMQRKLRMIGHRIDRHGHAAVLDTADRDQAWWIAQLWRLHAARWASVGEPGLLRDARLKQFHHRAMPELARRRLLRLYALVLGETVVGVYYGFHHAQSAYAYLGGFDPAFAYYSPGTYLVGHAVERAAAEGVRELHFLRGREAYKYAWGATDRWNSRRVLRRGSP